MVSLPGRRGGSFAVVLVFAVVLAGCAGFVPTERGNDAGTPVETFTPAVVPTDEPTPTPTVADVPGLSASGVENGTALLAAHARSLDGQSFTVRVNETALSENDTVETVDGLIRADERSVLFSRFGLVDATTPIGRSAGPARVESWSGGDHPIRAFFYPNGTRRYGQLPSSWALSRENAIQYDVFALANLTETRSRVVASIERNGTTLYRIRGRTTVSRGNATVDALVDTRGRIHEYRRQGTEYPRTNRPRRLRVRFTHVGSTTPERPSWYLDAIANLTNRPYYRD